MSSALQHLPPPLRAELEAALYQAAHSPARRSEILGNIALGLAARSQHRQHRKEAPVLRALAEQIAQAAMVAHPLQGLATRDDFEETLEEMDAAHGQIPEDIEVLARADELHDAKTAQAGQAAESGKRMSIAPLSWGKGATLGRTGRFRYNPSSDDILSNIVQSGTLAYWQGEPHEAQAITVDLTLSADGQPTPLLTLPSPTLPFGTGDVSSRPRGIVSYGSDGAITKVPFDAGFGTRLTVTGNYVAVQLSMDPPLGTASPGTLSFTTSIGAFASPSVAPVFYTVYLDQLAGGQTSVPIQRPMHASQILPILCDVALGTADLVFYGQGGATVLTRFSYPMGQLLNPIPLPSEVQYFTLTNNTGRIANFRIPCQLSL